MTIWLIVVGAHMSVVFMTEVKDSRAHYVVI